MRPKAAERRSSCLSLTLPPRAIFRPARASPSCENKRKNCSGRTGTQGCVTRDNMRYGCTDEELREWLTKASVHRDLVRLWDLQNGEPSEQQVETALAELAPVWLAWNSLG